MQHELHAAPSLDNEKITVPLTKLLSYDPQTYTINGVRHWGARALGVPASIDYSWSYTVTLQRVP